MSCGDLILRISAPPAGMTVAQIWEAYQEEMSGRRQAAKLAQTGKNVLPEFGHLAATQITKDDCRAYADQRRSQGRKDATIRTELGCLRAALLWAHKADLIHKAPYIERPPAPPPRDRHLSRSEVSALLASAIDPHIRLAMLLMLTTAGRSGAILELTWDRVDLDRRIIKLATNDIGPKKGRATGGAAGRAEPLCGGVGRAPGKVDQDRLQCRREARWNRSLHPA